MYAMTIQYRRFCLEMRKYTKENVILAVALAGVILLAGCKNGQPNVADRAAASTQPVAESMIAADRLYDGRSDPTKVREALIELKQDQLAEPSNYELAWRVARCDYFLGSHNPNDAEKEKAFREGIEAGKTAVKLQDSKPEGHFWLGANYGGLAEESTLAGLTDTDAIKREMETVIKIDEGYQAGSAYMVLGQVYLESPALLGGDRQKAIEYLEKGLRLGPTNALVRLHLAEAYLAVNRKEDARKTLDALFAMKPPPEYQPEYDDAIKEARQLQAKLK
jgi:tetratricopeptide (TPR) repeat protein